MDAGRVTCQFSGVHSRIFPILPCLILATNAALFGQAFDLLQDTHFQRGFHVLSPVAGRRVILRTLPSGNATANPAWDIAQWNSRYDLSAQEPAPPSNGGWLLQDRSKCVRLIHNQGGSGSLFLELDGTREFDQPRKQGEPWPHLLIQQSVTNCPPIAALSAVNLHVEACLAGKDNDDTGYDAALHCAQCPLVLIIQNKNAASPGYGDFFWFQVPLYDDRWEYPPPHVAVDTADPSAKLIYNPGLQAYTDATIQHGGWVRLDLDLLPHLRRGLEMAGTRGYLPDSRDPKDFKVTSFILGWEVTGRNRGAIEFRNLSLQAVQASAR
jgi:hypothetical protein